MRSLTVAICSYQRRDPLLAQLGAIEELIRGDPLQWEGVEIVVVLDGSTDGSREALEHYELSAPLRVHWHPNAGLAAARNACLRLASGEVIWLLDDDLIPAQGTVERHRLAHEVGEAHLVLGPCVIPDSADVPDGVRRWWDERHEALGKAGKIDAFEQIAMANVSCPVQLLRDIGGFSEGFVAYGLEDNEIGARLLAAGRAVLFDSEAIVWHHMTVSDLQTFQRQRSLGFNAVRFAQLHPELVHQGFPKRPESRTLRLVEHLPFGSSTLAWKVATASYKLLGPAERRVGRHAWRVRRLAWEAAYSAGVTAARRPGRETASGHGRSEDTARQPINTPPPATNRRL